MVAQRPPRATKPALTRPQKDSSRAFNQVLPLYTSISAVCPFQPGSGDFALRPGSPALALGFESIQPIQAPTARCTMYWLEAAATKHGRFPIKCGRSPIEHGHPARPSRPRTCRGWLKAATALCERTPHGPPRPAWRPGMHPRSPGHSTGGLGALCDCMNIALTRPKHGGSRAFKQVMSTASATSRSNTCTLQSTTDILQSNTGAFQSNTGTFQ